MDNIIPYKPNDFEAEKASNAYLMSLIAIMAGLPLPIINLLATCMFFLGNLKSSRFVRWHCTQALFSQLFVFVFNSIGFSWTMSILFGDNHVTNQYIAYIITIVLFNITEIIFTIVASVQVRKGKHPYLWIFGGLTDAVLGDVKYINNPINTATA